MLIVLVMTDIPGHIRSRRLTYISSQWWMTAILYSNSAWMYMHVIGLIDNEFIYVEHTLIVWRNNLHIQIITEIRTHIGRILILRYQPIQY